MALFRSSTTLESIGVVATEGASTEILYSEYTSGMVSVVAGSACVTLTWYVAEKIGGTYLPAQDYDGAAVVQTVAHTKAYPIPLSLIGAVALKAVGDDTGTIHISLKA